MLHSARSKADSSKASHRISRRHFFEDVAGATAAAAIGAAVVPGTLAQAAPEITSPEGELVKRGDRVEQAYEMRVHAALVQKRLQPTAQRVNGDEDLYSSRIGNYTKALPHGDTGEVDRDAYLALLRVLKTGTTAGFETLALGGAMRLSNPQAGLGFELEGGDSHYFVIAEPPTFASAQQAGEMAELYWQSLTRDVPFAHYDADPLIGNAVTDLTRLSHFYGPRTDGRIMPKTIFRGNTAGDLNGPYLSQFLWQDVPYGATRIVQRIRTVVPGLDYLTSFSHWLGAQNGTHPMTANRLEETPRYIRNSRDLGRYVQVDFTYQTFLNACLILLGTGASLDPANPYKASATQSGFCTFGPAHVLDLVAKVANYSLKASWYQKWYVHRRLRPEEFGGTVHKVRKRLADYPIHSDLLNSPALETVFNRTGTYLLPQAYAEGCPTHPSYPAGHAVVAGACATVLKAFFDESFQIRRPVEAAPDGLSVAPYRGPELYVGDELNKLAANVAIARNAAGVHWRSDATEGLRLGQDVAISLMTEERGCLSENFDGFTLTKFDGSQVVL